MVCENHKFVLTEECPKDPISNGPKNVRDIYDAWIQSSNKAKCFMLVSMDDVLQTHGAIIDDKTQVSMILESLSPYFKAFTTNYVINKLEFNMTQILNKLTALENLNNDMSKEGESNIVEAKSNSPPSSSKKRKWNIKDNNGGKPKGKMSPKAKKNKASPKSKDKKGKGKCFYCGVMGH
uniref:Gag/pol protein n=1 Tax=Cannabis sativa TaxID=3483 RepID=A0A803NI11_CANSA